MRKNPFKKIFEMSEQKTNDTLGAYPEKVHVRAMPERRYLKTTRILTIFSIISLSLSILLASIIYMMVPFANTEVKLIEKDKRVSGLKYIDKSEARESPFALEFEKFAIDYVVMRHEVKADLDVLVNLWSNEKSRLNLRSNADVQLKIKSEFEATKSKVVSQNFTRRINVLSVRKFFATDINAVFFVRFETIDLYKDKADEKIKIWESLVRLRRGNPIVKPKLNMNEKEGGEDNYTKQVIHNPLNINVTNYVLSFIGERSSYRRR